MACEQRPIGQLAPYGAVTAQCYALVSESEEPIVAEEGLADAGQTGAAVGRVGGGKGMEELRARFAS